MLLSVMFSWVQLQIHRSPSMTGKYLPQITGAWPSPSGQAVLELALGQVFLAEQKESKHSSIL